MIPLLFNENMPSASARRVRRFGLDVQLVIEVMPGASDVAVLQHAYQHERAVVTFDRDYGELVFKRHLNSKGIIYLRFIPATPEEPADVLERLFMRTDVVIERQFTVVERQQIRQRRLPEN